MLLAKALFSSLIVICALRNTFGISFKQFIYNSTGRNMYLIQKRLQLKLIDNLHLRPNELADYWKTNVSI